MPKIEILAVGKMRDKNQQAMVDEYIKRIKWPVSIIEITDKSPEDSYKKTLEKIKSDAFVFIMDETGKTVSSRALSKKINNAIHAGFGTLQFVIGGADGHNDAIRQKANFCLSFGLQTWPHMLVRIMLVEQIYRSQQIIAGHPYHRD